MLVGFLFIFVFWVLPILIWYFVQGRKEIHRVPNCPSQEAEQKQAKAMLGFAIGFGLFIILIVLIFAS